MWAFEAYAEGLTTTATDAKPSDEPPRQLHKTSRNNDLFDASGKPLAAEDLHRVTTWRTHHAFGGRCALVKPDTAQSCSTSQGSTGNPSWAEQALSAYQDWSIAFRLGSTTTEEPHILLSVAPAYVPLMSSPTGETLEPDAATLASLPAAPTAEEQQHYNSRLLDTPLIWEEAYALSVECTPRGMFLWSDHWELYGKKIADRCLEVRKKAEADAEVPPIGEEGTMGGAPTTYNGAVRLRFNTPSMPPSGDGFTGSTSAVLAVDVQSCSALSDLAANATRGSDDVLWHHVMDVPLPMDALARQTAFRPHVTLLESGDSVRIE